MRSIAKRRRLEGMDILSAAILTLIAVIIAFPFYTALVTSITSNASYLKYPVQLIPRSFTLENYSYVFERLDIVVGYRNTLFVVVVGTVMSMLISLMYAYGLAIKNYPGKRLAFIYLLITMYFGGGLMPIYMLVRDLGLVNNPMSVVFICGMSPFNIIIMKNGIDQLPPSLGEAARIDGAGEWHIFTRVTLPLIKPIAVTFSLFTAVGYWNEWYWSMILLTRPEVRTLQIMLRAVVSTIETMELGAGAADYVEVFSQGLKMAAVMITMLPIMAVYPFLQKHFAQGILVGAIKM